jgi:hypothetical protein
MRRRCGSIGDADMRAVRGKSVHIRGGFRLHIYTVSRVEHRLKRAR